jgi:hypothetical protein
MSPELGFAYQVKQWFDLLLLQDLPAQARWTSSIA